MVVSRDVTASCNVIPKERRNAAPSPVRLIPALIFGNPTTLTVHADPSVIAGLPIFFFIGIAGRRGKNCSGNRGSEREIEFLHRRETWSSPLKTNTEGERRWFGWGKK